jgi:hypothetical protein
MVVDTLVVVNTLVVGDTLVAVLVTVVVWVGMLSWRFFSKFSLWFAPAKRPMNIELSRRSIRARMSSVFVRAVRGSCTREAI